MTANDVVSRRRTDTSDELVLAVPADPGVISVARLFAAAACRHAGFDDAVIEDAKIAVSEAVTNAVKAHLAVEEAMPVRVIARRTVDDEVRIEVVDAGVGFDIEKATASEARTPPGGLFEGSLGLTVVRSLFPDLLITRNADRGMTVAFTVTRAPVELDAENDGAE